jgi:2-iminobutanoate/2-iminopropanoate deaminase
MQREGQIHDGHKAGVGHASKAAQEERRLLGLPPTTRAAPGILAPAGRVRPSVQRRAIHAPDVLNDAPAYQLAASFSRGLCVSLPAGARLLLFSGTASVGANGESLYAGDFEAQCWRTYRNLTRLLESEGATWHDIVRTSCYLRDIERDYDSFNRIRTEFFSALGLDPLPASTGIQARLCRSDLLIEIEAMAMLAPAPESG